MKSAPLVGIFVGGKGSRLGGLAKGSLRAPGGVETLLERSVRLCREYFSASSVTLVGDGSAYTTVNLPALADDPPGIGPLGGLHALLCEAERRGQPQVIALSCDLPYFTLELLRRLDQAPPADVVAARQSAYWQPLFTRYASSEALAAVRQALAAGDRSLQRVLARLTVLELELDEAEQALLRDWDEPADLEQ